MPRNPGPPPVQNRNAQPQGRELVVQNLATIVDGMNREDRYQTFLDLLGSKAAVDRWKAVALHTIATNNNLLMQADPLSVIEACREAAVLGLDVTGLRGEGWLIVYDKTAKFQPGWQGLLKVILDTGRIRVADCQLVHEKDGFELELGTQPSIRHQPVLAGAKKVVSKGAGEKRHDEEQFIVERGDVVGAYAWSKLDSGELLIEWMTYADIEQARLASPAVQRGQSSPWDGWWGEMARKTVLRRLMKRLPRTGKVGFAIELDAQVDEKERELLGTPGKQSARDAALAALPGATGETAGDQHGDAEKKDEVVVVTGDEGKDAKPVGETADAAATKATNAGATDAGVNAAAESTKKKPEVKATGGEMVACDVESPYGGDGRCLKPKGHDGTHRSSNRETWN